MYVPTKVFLSYPAAGAVLQTALHTRNTAPAARAPEQYLSTPHPSPVNIHSSIL